jgi:hypothetical protein
MMSIMEYGLAQEEEEEKPIDIGAGTSLDLLQAIYRDVDQTISRRLRAARAALPFEHPRLAVAVNVSAEGLAKRMAIARERLGQGGYVIDAQPKALADDPGQG